MFELDKTPVKMKPNSIVGLASVFWVLLRLAQGNRPRWPQPFRFLLASVWFAMFLTTYFLHTLGHIRSARRAGAPMDAVVLDWGVQMNVYYNNHVTPGQHIGRASGGPLVTGALAATGYLFWRLVRGLPVIRDLAEAWYAFNAMGLVLSLTPSPHFDAASLLRWGVTRQTGEEALGDEAVQQAGYGAAAGLLLASVVLLLRGKGALALFCAGLSIFTILDLSVLRGKLP